VHPALAARLAALSPDQREAAIADPGPVLCIAPAGSGKTTTLVARVCWLVDEGVPPDRIRAVTFNRRAAVELEERLETALAAQGVAPGAVRTGTFHALGREILIDAGRPVEPLVDRAMVLAELLGPVPGAVVARIDIGISRLKLGGGGEAPSPRLKQVYQAYESALGDREGLDFDDLIARPLQLLEEDGRRLAGWRVRIEHLLVDEAQDLDQAQLRLALLLSAPEHRIFVVGDDDQTIYGWRLADVRRLLGLAERLPGIRRVYLITNRRCPKQVVERAVRLVSNNRERFPKRIVPRPEATGSLVLARDPGDDAARARVLLSRWPPGEGTAAILARTNAELAAYAAVALEKDVPYAAEEDGLLVDDAGIDDLLADAERRIQASGPAGPWAHLVALAAVRRDANPDRAGLAAAVLAWAVGYPDLASTRVAIEAARRRREAWRASQEPPLLTLATVHGTKGLEFDHVAVVGLDEGRFPNRRSVEEAAEPLRAYEEERRLAYVAWTRARKSLTLIYDPAAPSPFLLEAFDPGELAS
jgi:DNA helicase-2/ATP-dependent DNA helicase PcrA